MRLLLLDESGSASEADLDLDVDLDDEPEDERVLRCTSCDHPITRAANRIARDGRHIHVFTNPHGYTFQIACFDDAPGAAALGAPSDEWAWFAGFSWRMAACRGCSEHLGWSFENADTLFWGLITAKVYE